VLQNIKVLANGQNIDKPETSDANSVKAVTLLVSPDQAEKLALASSEGKLYTGHANSSIRCDEETQGVNKREAAERRTAVPVPEPDH
jgi:pilus assembly protein CpaB